MRITSASITLAVAACWAGAAAAADFDPSVNFSGFGTIAATTTGSKNVAFSVPAQKGSVGWPEISFGPDSKLGVQANGKLNSIFSGTVQVLSKKDGNDTFDPVPEWAFVKAQVLPALSVRAGRMGAPFFMVSDYRDVNYANLWVRPPIDVYGQVDLSHFEGADLTYQGNVGSASITASAFKGHSDTVDGGTPVHVNGLWGLNVTAELDGGITLRAGRAAGQLTIESAGIDGLLAGLQQAYAGINAQVAPLGLAADPSLLAVGQQFDPTKKAASFSGVGINIDRNDWIANLEYTWRRTDSYVPNTTGYAFTLGHRVGQWTPYGVYSRTRLDSYHVVNNIPTNYQAPLPAPFGAAVTAAIAPIYAQLNGAVAGALLGQTPAQHTISLGARWDFHRNVAAKAQVDIITTDDGSNGWLSAGPGFAGDATVYSLSLDFVF